MPKILNIGSLNIDHVYRVPRFVKPGETLSSFSLQDFPGGKGLNQSIALARAGAEVSHVGKIGSDGEFLIQHLTAAGVNVCHIDRMGSSTGHAIIQVNDDGQNCILLYSGANRELNPERLKPVFADFNEGDFLVLQDEVNSVAEMMLLAKSHKMQVVFNHSPMRGEILSYPLECVDWFLLNEAEGQALTQKNSPEDILDEMHRRYPSSVTVLTLGKDGVVCKAGSHIYSHGIYNIPVVDTTAAGDTFTGFFIASIAKGRTINEALHLASVASSLAVSRKGASVSIPSLSEVENFR